MKLDAEQLCQRLFDYLDDCSGEEFAETYNLIFGTYISYNERDDTFEEAEG